MRNRFIEELSKMHNSVVEDLESLSKEITFTQSKIEEVDEKRYKDSDLVKKNFLDMEAFINTLVSNEKAARTAMANQLAEDVDLSCKDYTKKIDDIATYCGDINTALEDTTSNIGNLDTEHTNFYYEFQNYKDSNENAIRDIVIRMSMEKMLNMLETYEVGVKTIAGKNNTVMGKVSLIEKHDSKAKGANKAGKLPKDQDELNELVDRKLEKVYERVRNDNWVIWKESIRLAEKEFSENGIQQTQDFLPKVTYDKKDLKRTINSLMFDDAEQLPKPVVKVKQTNPPPRKQSPSVKKPEMNESKNSISKNDESMNKSGDSKLKSSLNDSREERKK